MNNKVTTSPGYTLKKFFYFWKIFPLWLALSGTALPARALWYYTIRSGDWNSPSTWSTDCPCDHLPASTVPGPGDNIYMGSHTITVSSNVSCISITQSRGSIGTITVNTGTTLSVSDAINVYTYSATISTSLEVNGGGMLITGSVNIGDNLFDFTSTGYQTIFSSSVSNLIVSGNVTLLSNSFTPGTTPYYNNARLNVNAGTATVNGTIATTNENAGNVSYITLSNSSPTLKLAGATPFSLSGTGTNSVTLNGSGATVDYGYAGNQDVLNKNYSNLILSGSGVKTLLGNTLITGNLTVRAGTNFNLGFNTFVAPALTILECGAPVGSVISGNTTLTLGGPVTVNSLGTGNSGATISCWIDLVNTRIFAISDDGTSAPDLSITDGRIYGTGAGITKYGPGKLYLFCEGSYFSGPLTINEGVVEVSKLANKDNPSSIGNGTVNPEITIGGSGTLRFARTDYFNGSTNRPLIITGNGATLDAAATADMTLSGTISGNSFGLVLTGTKTGRLTGTINTAGGTVTKNGSGTWYLTQANNHSGGTILNQGVLLVSNSQALGNPAATFTINGGFIGAGVDGITLLDYPLALNGDFSKSYYDLHMGNGPVTLNGDRTVSINWGNLTIGGIINAPTFSLTKAGTYTLYFGNQDISLKNLTLSGGNLSSTSGNLNINGNFTNNGYFIHNNGTVTFSGANQQISGNPTDFNHLHLSGTGGVKTISGTVRTNGSLTIDQPLTIASTGNLSDPAGAVVINAMGGTLQGSVINKGTSTLTNCTFNRTIDDNRWFILSSPVTSGLGSFQSGNAIGQEGEEFDLAAYSEGGNTWSYYTALSGNFIPGKGYLAAFPTAGTKTFPSGTLRTTGLTYPLSYSAAYYGWNGVGNPFASALRITDNGNGINDEFLSTVPGSLNSQTLDPEYFAVYVWNQDGAYDGTQEYYRVISNAGYTSGNYTAINGDYIQPGQGFLVAAGRAGSIEFTTAMQEHQNPEPLKAASPGWPGITLNVRKGNFTRQSVVTFHERMTTGMDRSYDAGLLSASDFRIYTRLADGSSATPFAVQALPGNSFDKLVVPVGIDLKEGGNITFTASGILLPAGVPLLLEDRQNRTFTPLNSAADSYTTFLPANSAGANRFFLHFGQPTALSDDRKEAMVNAWFANRKIIIQGIGQSVDKAQLFDMNGRQMGEYLLQKANRNEIPAGHLVSGIYLLKAGSHVIRVPVINP